MCAHQFGFWWGWTLWIPDSLVSLQCLKNTPSAWYIYKGTNPITDFIVIASLKSNYLPKDSFPDNTILRVINRTYELWSDKNIHCITKSTFILFPYVYFGMLAFTQAKFIFWICTFTLPIVTEGGIFRLTSK